MGTKDVKVSDIVTLKAYCTEHNLDYKAYRRASRKGLLEGAQLVLGTWAIAKDAKVVDLPKVARKATREDGRQPFKVYLTDAEAKDLASKGYDLKDPRIARKARKAAKAAKAEATKADK